MAMATRAVDHIGWDLARASAVWKAEFSESMAAAGYKWFLQARSGLIQHIGPNGVRQSDLVLRSALTKQAVQQFVDELITDGIVVRQPDAQDGRAKRVMLTELGSEAMRVADQIKRTIEARYLAHLGAERFAALREGLQLLLADRRREEGSGGR